MCDRYVEEEERRVKPNRDTVAVTWEDGGADLTLYDVLLAAYHL